MKNKISLDWSIDGRRDLYSIFDYYENIDPLHGLRCIEEIERQIKNIKDHPLLGVASQKRRGVRKLIIAGTPYITAYTLLPNQESPKVAYILSVVSSFNDTEAKKI